MENGHSLSLKLSLFCFVFGCFFFVFFGGANKVAWFLGGLSLHLNDLIAWRVGILFGNLGHFPLEFFCQIWTQDTL